MNVLLVRQGDKYGSEYVKALRKQLFDFNVATLTDQWDTPGDTQPLRSDLKGWWAKLELFAPWNRALRPALYIDLDSFVFKSPAQYNMGGEFAMVEDFVGPSPANSSVMWIPQETAKIWDAFDADPEKNMKSCGGYGDQKFLAPFATHLWKTPDDGITSFRALDRDWETT